MQPDICRLAVSCRNNQLDNQLGSSLCTTCSRLQHQRKHIDLLVERQQACSIFAATCVFLALYLGMIKPLHFLFTFNRFLLFILSRAILGLVFTDFFVFYFTRCFWPGFQCIFIKVTIKLVLT